MARLVAGVMRWRNIETMAVNVEGQSQEM